MSRRRQLLDGLPDEHGAAERCAADGTAKAFLSVHPPNPRSSPCSTPDPGKNAKNAAPLAPLRGPGPRRLHQMSGRVRSVPGRVASEDDPCLGLRALRTGGDCGFFIIRHRCDKVNTLVGDLPGFFCHSVI